MCWSVGAVSWDADWQSTAGWGKVVVVGMLRRDEGAVVYESMSPQTGVMGD